MQIDFKHDVLNKDFFGIQATRLFSLTSLIKVFEMVHSKI